MDHFISVLTAFTPKNLEYSDNELYHKAVRLHVQKVEKLFKENANAAAGFADLLFQVRTAQLNCLDLSAFFCLVVPSS